MSIWSYNIIRVDGQLFAYIRIQDDYTGNIAGRFSKVHQSGFDYYFRAEGKRNLCTRQVDAFLSREVHQKAAIEFYDQHVKQIKGFIR